MALKLIRLTGRRMAWSLIAVALVLMSVRRAIPFYHLLFGDPAIVPDLLNELVGLALSLLMVLGVAGIAPLFSAIKSSEEALRQSEERFKQVAENAGEWIWEVDADGLYTYASPAVEKMLGYKPEEIVGNIHFYDLFVPEEKEELKKATLEAIAQHESFRDFVNPNLHKDGSRVILETSGIPVLDGCGTLISYRGADKNITERTRAEKALRESENTYRTIFENTGNVTVIIEEDTTVLLVNSRFEKLMGWSKEEVEGKMSWTQFVPPEDLDLMTALHRLRGEVPDAVPKEYEIRLLDKSGTIKPARLSIDMIAGTTRSVVSVTDITASKMAEEERERLQQRLQQSQKLEAIGTMAGGIAHDFNNILTGILGFTELVRSEVSEGSPIHDNLTEVVLAGRRARDLVRQILSFSRKAETEKSLISLGTIVKEALKLIRSVIPSHITIRHNFTVSAEHSILADPTQMHQIVMNLCLNAADAMPDGGVLEISLEEVQVETESRPEQTQLPSGCYLKLTVRDNGAGIPPEVRERIFEPYFTTKQVGKGTGMGLAVVHGVIKEHGGSIAVSSEPGKGTAFEICLPIVEATPDTEIESTPVVVAGSESILFVDDETMITNLQRLQLGKWGYCVTATESSATALNMFRANPQGFDLVITDLTMPGITGIKLAQAIHEISPSTPIILCTGLDEGISRENARMIGIHAILSKPTTGAEFSHTMRLVLDEARKSSQAKS
ncbi:MAG: PAS domain S-box protein [candidate division Zixibacteria bacterium]|nr:PAS domain S-box protein [candidate division Zixibacteria bacterium]